MSNSGHGGQDQRTNSTMEDSTMTIDYLRARLLAERSVSKSARQRADDLAKRVAELEEQLMVVSLQRKKAEKATAEVLSILENNGICDISEAFDSSSEQDTPCESKTRNTSPKDENLVDLKVRKNESDELSGPDHDFSSLPGRSLSWKGRKDALCSNGKYKDSLSGRKNSFSYTGSSSPKQRRGSSCRRIRRNETRSVSVDSQKGSMKDDSRENGLSTASESFPTHSDGGQEISESIAESQSEKSLLENDGSENGKSLASHEVDFTGREREMEKALEDQAKLIDKYEAMENAQREWEEKFRENNSSTPDTGDPGSHSDITEERYEIKAQTSAHELKPEEQDGCFHMKMQPDLSTPSADINCTQDQNCSSGHASVSSTQEFAFPTEVAITQRSFNQEIPGKGYYPPPHTSQNSQLSHVSHDQPKNQSAHVSSSNGNFNGFKGEDSGSQNGHFALVPHRERGVGSVLEKLKLAKQSLKQKIGGLELIEGGSAERAVGLSIPTVKTGDQAEIPIGFAGLFRLPTDYSVEANRTEFVSPGTELRLGNYQPHTGVKVTDTGNPFPSPYVDTRSRFSADDGFHVNRYGESGSRFPAQMSHFDPYLDRGTLSPSIYTYPTLPASIHYPNMMPRNPTSEGFSRTYSSRTVGIPSSDHLLYNDHIRPNMYNR